MCTVSYRYSINGVRSHILKAERDLRQGDPISPLLFVLMMEYLHRILLQLKDELDFNFHPKCERLNIVNLCFADGLLLFVRGDIQSVELLMDQFNKFSISTGLVVNKQKCRLYCGGLRRNLTSHLISITRFVEGKLPVKYLGVPLTTRKLTIRLCQPLIDKITARIRHWSSKLLTYAGKMQLIRSVLHAMSNYWMQIFPLPKNVIHHIEALCRSFLWSGIAEITRRAPIAWDKVCDTKNVGGLNLTSLLEWNSCNIAKLLWNICRKVDKLWVKWVHSYYIKDCEVMDVEIPADSSWILKAIMKSRAMVHQSNAWASMW